jgi:hypothetical protein
MKCRRQSTLPWSIAAPGHKDPDWPYERHGTIVALLSQSHSGIGVPQSFISDTSITPAAGLE